MYDPRNPDREPHDWAETLRHAQRIYVSASYTTNTDQTTVEWDDDNATMNRAYLALGLIAANKLRDRLQQEIDVAYDLHAED